MKLVEPSINNHIFDVIHQHHNTKKHSTSAPNEHVLRNTQLAKPSFNNPSVVLTDDVFFNFYYVYHSVHKSEACVVRNVLVQKYVICCRLFHRANL